MKAKPVCSPAAAPFLADAACFAASALLISLIDGQFQAIPQRDEASASLWREIRDGGAWFWKHRLLRTLGIMAGVVNFYSTAGFSIFVLVAQDRLGLSPVEYGLVLSAGAVGGVLAGLSAERLNRRLGTGGVLFLTNFLPAIAYVVIAQSSHAGVLAAMFILLSFSPMVGNVLLISLRQVIIPDRLLGRVTSAYRLFALGAVPAGALVGGFLALRFGLTAPYWMAAAVMGVMAFALLPVVNNRTLAAARQAAQ
ncbi:MAG: MFS transporter [Chloroflexota bacterium]